MDLIRNKNIVLHNKIRLLTRGLIFSLLLTGCAEKPGNNSLSLQWKENKATGIIIPGKMVTGIPNDSISSHLKVYRVNDSTRSVILGEYHFTEDGLVFEPLIPLTRGLSYKIISGSLTLGEIEVPLADKKDAPRVLAVYPTGDTLPENLLKIYIKFSSPMQEGEALQHIVLIKDGTDTLNAAFLDLQPELWNNEHTILTLWLDPGRIKRNLQPNKAMGTPLTAGHHYQVVIKQDWRDIHGNLLSGLYQKSFVTGPHDRVSPDIQQWHIHLPEAGTPDPLRIDLNESLDYVLLNHAVRIVDSSGIALKGTLHVGEKEASLYFTPGGKWNPGNYILETESRLEDLAGNNLQRLFDKDISRQSGKEEKKVYRRSFQVNKK